MMRRRKLEDFERLLARGNALTNQRELFANQCARRVGWVSGSPPDCTWTGPVRRWVRWGRTFSKWVRYGRKVTRNPGLRCCNQWAQCNYKQCLKEAWQTPWSERSAVRRECRRTRAREKKVCKRDHAANAFVPEPDAIDLADPELDEGRRELAIAEDGRKNGRKLDASEAEDGCLSLQELLWNPAQGR